MKRNTKYIHGLIWLIYSLLTYLLIKESPNFEWEELGFSTLLVFFQAGLFYWHAYWLMPRFLEQKRYIIYGLILLLTMLGFALSFEYLMYIDTPVSDHQNNSESAYSFFSPFSIFLNLTPVLIIFSASFVYKYLQNQRQQEQNAYLLMEAESKFLKSQMNPHFLFNSLNNIYAMAQLKEDKTPAAIFQLSEILRYILYESNKEKVALEKEVKYLKSFIQLSLLKEETTTGVQTNFEKLPPNLQIVPMLLIPFIENSFKHSNFENESEGWINIHLKCEGTNLSFVVKNSVGGEKTAKDGQGGIGLKNVQRRLNLLYPDKHELSIQKNEEEFSVQLKIELDEI